MNWMKLKRYKIHIDVQDSTGFVSLVLWDWEANKLIKKSAKTLYEEVINGDPDMDLFPVDIKSLEDKKFAFKIQITKYNLQHNNKIYTISKLTKDPTIVLELQKKLDFQQVSEPHSMHAEQVSFTTENETPSTWKSKNLVTELNNNNDLKRVLVDIYDDDESPTNSVCKARKQSKEVKIDLKIPKLEK